MCARSRQMLVDRCSPSASSATAELMLESAVSRMPVAPKIVVLDSITRYESYLPSFEVLVWCHAPLPPAVSAPASRPPGAVRQHARVAP